MTSPPHPPQTRAAVVVDLRSGAPPPPRPTRSADPRDLLVRLEREQPEDRPPLEPRLMGGETLPLGLQRIALGHFDELISASRSPDPHTGGATEAWEATQRLRSLLRAIRGPLGNDTYRNEDAVLRTCSTILDDVREADASLKAARLVSEERDDLRLQPLVAELEREHVDAWRRTLGDGNRRATLVVTAACARARFASWPAHPGTRRRTARRVLVDDSFDSIADGLGEAYNRGGSHFDVAVRDFAPPAIRRWLRAVRVLRDQMELVQNAWPDVLGGVVSNLDDLVGTLQREQEAGRLAWRLSIWTTGADQARFAAIVDLESERDRLRRRAAALAERIYAEPTDAFVARIAAYWRSWRGPVPWHGPA